MAWDQSVFHRVLVLPFLFFRNAFLGLFSIHWTSHSTNVVSYMGRWRIFKLERYSLSRSIQLVLLPLLRKPSSLPKIARHMLVSSCLFCGIHPTVRTILPTYSVSFVVVETSWSPIHLSFWKTWATNSLVVFTNRFSPFMEEPWPGQDKLVFREKNEVPWCAHK